MTEKQKQELFKNLYKQNFKALYTFIRYKVNSDEIAEDICADTFLDAMNQIDKFKGDSSYKTWLYAIAKIKIINWIKHKNNFTEFEINKETMHEKGETQDHSDSKLLKNVLKELKDKYSQVLELRYLLNYSVKETAEVMQLSTQNVKVLQHRALKKAQQLLNNKNEN